MNDGVNMVQAGPFNFWPPNEPTSRNKLLACSPFPKQNVEKKVNRGLVMAEHKISIQELELLFTSESYAKGQKVYVRGDRVMQPWAKEVFTMDGKEFILVPESEIVFSKWEHNGPVVVSVPAVTFSSTPVGGGGPTR